MYNKRAFTQTKANKNLEKITAQQVRIEAEYKQNNYLRNQILIFYESLILAQDERWRRA